MKNVQMISHSRTKELHFPSQPWWRNIQGELSQLKTPYVTLVDSVHFEYEGLNNFLTEQLTANVHLMVSQSCV